MQIKLNWIESLFFSIFMENRSARKKYCIRDKQRNSISNWKFCVRCILMWNNKMTNGKRIFHTFIKLNVNGSKRTMIHFHSRIKWILLKSSEIFNLIKENRKYMLVYNLEHNKILQFFHVVWKAIENRCCILCICFH